MNLSPSPLKNLGQLGVVMIRRQKRFHGVMSLAGLVIVTALAGCANDTDIERLSLDLRSQSLSRRVSAVQSLGTIRSSRTIEPLVGALNDEDASVRKGAAWALTRISDPQVVNVLIKALSHNDPNVAKAAALALTGHHASTAVEGLISALEVSDPSIRKRAASILGRIGDPRALKGLRQGLLDRHCSRECADALCQLGWTPQTPDDTVHLLAATGQWTALKEKWALTLELFLKEMDAADHKVVDNALHALMNVAPEDAVPALIENLNKSRSKVMADVFLTCRHEKLRQAAREWARENDYSFSTGFGDQPPATSQGF